MDRPSPTVKPAFSSPSNSPAASSFRPTLTVNPPKPSPTIKRLSPAELQARREKGLCYNCDEKYIQGHRCKRLFHLLIVEPDKILEEAATLQLEAADLAEKLVVPDLEPDPAQISLHALMSHSVPRTLRVLGQIHQSPVAILIDSGSTHNFLPDRVVKQLGLPTQPAPSFRVLVGNDEVLRCTTMCTQVQLHMGQHTFTVDLFVLPLSGAELVLGVQWLETLGPIVTDFKKLTMSFNKDGETVLLTGAPKPSPEESNVHQFQRLLQTDAIDTFLHLQMITP